MKIVILKDSFPNSQTPDALDNQIEADFAQHYLSQKHIVSQCAFVPDVSAVKQQLQDANPDLVFNLVETVCGNDALSVVAVQLLEMLGIPYTGCPMYAQVATADKMLMKQVLQAQGIPTPSAHFVPRASFILKARAEHASVGLDSACVRSFASADALAQAVAEKANATGRPWMAEQYIEGREFSCAFVGQTILPPAEFCFDPHYEGHKIITYQAKWNEDAPAYKQHWRRYDFEEDIKVSLASLTAQCRKALFMRGYARVDFRRDAAGNLYVIDINTNPCISPDSTFIDMAGKAQIPLDQLFDKIIEDALLEYPFAS